MYPRGVLPFPEEWELVSLSEGEPILTDANVPWVYNRLQFSLVRGDDRIECVIEPSDGHVGFAFASGGRTVVDMVLNRVAGLRVYRTDGTEGLVVQMEDPSREDLDVQVSPFIRFSWRSGAD